MGRKRHEPAALLAADGVQPHKPVVVLLAQAWDRFHFGEAVVPPLVVVDQRRGARKVFVRLVLNPQAVRQVIDAHARYPRVCSVVSNKSPA
jgi:hypothetical protein